jgi:hypothetical protein
MYRDDGSSDGIEDIATEELGTVVVAPTGSCSSDAAASTAVRVMKTELSDLAAFVMRPVQRFGTLQCFIHRERGGIGQQPTCGARSAAQHSMAVIE